MPPSGNETPLVSRRLPAPLKRCSSVSTELFERGPRFAPSTASSASAPFSNGVVEGLLEHVEDIDAGDAQELAHRIAAEQPDIEAEFRGAHGIGPRAARDARRAAVVLLAEHARELEHLCVIVGERRVSALGSGPDSSLSAVENEVLALGSQGDRARLVRASFRPCAARVSARG